MSTKMGPCTEYEDVIAASVAGTLSDAEEHQLRSHLGSCQRCSVSFAEFNSTILLAKSVDRIDPGPVFFAGYFERLEGRMNESPAPVPSRPAMSLEARIRLALSKWSLPSPAIKRFALAAALIGIGVFVGRIAFPEVVTVPANTGNPSQLAHAEIAEARAFEYLGRTKTLLIGLVNFDAESENPELLNLPRRQEIANELLVQATNLKSELSDTEQHRLEGLIEDLELILTQIANIEASSDSPAIEILRGGVDRTGVLFRINVEEMRRESLSVSSPSSKTTVDRAVKL